MQIKIVWISKVSPIANGWLICIKINDKENVNKYISWILSRGSLFKILILEINEKELSFLLKF